VNRAWDIFSILFLVSTVLAVVIGGMVLLTRTWEYRAVYHYDCASYLTES
jgi:hypothetical protein